MKWTIVQPKVGGYYFVRYLSRHEMEHPFITVVVHVTVPEPGGQLYAHTQSNHLGVPLSAQAFIGAQWSDAPIPEPTGG